MNKYPKLRYGTIGLYCLHTFRFEYRYCLFIRKFFKKLFKRRRRKITTFYKRRVWLFIRPNYTLTHKSKNARMGKGKGNFKRWCTIVHPGKVFIEHLNVSPRLYNKYFFKMQIKLKLQLKIIKKHSKCIKTLSLTSSTVTTAAIFDIYRTRKKLYSTEFFY